MKLNFTNPNADNYVPIRSKDNFHQQQFKLIASNNCFLALALYSEGYVKKTYKGPEKKGNPTFGIGINLASLTPAQRKEGMEFAGFSQKEIDRLNSSMKKGQIPEVKITIQQALNFAEWHRQKISGPAAERHFGKEFLEKLPPMRKAAIEYVFFHYGEGSALKMKNLMNKLKNEDFAELGPHATSSRAINYKGKDVLIPNSRTGLILDLAFKDMGAGEFFFFSAVGANGERVREVDAMAIDYDKKAKKTIASLAERGMLKYSGNNIVKISTHTDQYIEKLNDKDLINYISVQKTLNKFKDQDFVSEEEVLKQIEEDFKEAVKNKNILAENNFEKIDFIKKIQEADLFNEKNENVLDGKINKPSLT